MTELRRLTVDLGDRSYPIIIGPGAIADSGNFTPYIRSRQLLIVTNETVAPLYLDTLLRTLGDHYRIESVVLPDGEEYKTSASYSIGNDLANLERCIFDVKVWNALQNQK